MPSTANDVARAIFFLLDAYSSFRPCDVVGVEFTKECEDFVVGE